MLKAELRSETNGSPIIKPAMISLQGMAEVGLPMNEHLVSTFIFNDGSFLY